MRLLNATFYHYAFSIIATASSHGSEGFGLILLLQAPRIRPQVNIIFCVDYVPRNLPLPLLSPCCKDALSLRQIRELVPRLQQGVNGASVFEQRGDGEQDAQIEPEVDGQPVDGGFVHICDLRYGRENGEQSLASMQLCIVTVALRSSIRQQSKARYVAGNRDANSMPCLRSASAGHGEARAVCTLCQQVRCTGGNASPASLTSD